LFHVRIRTGKFDPESTKSFISQSLNLKKRGKDLALREDGFFAYSNVACFEVLVSEVV